MKKNMKLILGTMTFGQQVKESEAFQIAEYFKQCGYSELDTAYIYNEGNSEKIIGQIVKQVNPDDYALATKVHPRITGRLDYDSVMSQFETSIVRMKVSRVDILYLHFPDINTPVESALQACDELYKQGRIKELGLSNFSANMVRDICERCDFKGWIKPTVYQGVYNALSRKSEGKLFEILKECDMRFYGYNPLAGGLLTGKYIDFEEKPMDGRFAYRQTYQKKYWKESYFDAVKVIKKTCEESGLTMAEAAFRWLAYHSSLEAGRGDGIIVGVSKIQQLKDNIEMVKQGTLPDGVKQVFDQAWEICKDDAPEYYRYYTS